MSRRRRVDVAAIGIASALALVGCTRAESPRPAPLDTSWTTRSAVLSCAQGSVDPDVGTRAAAGLPGIALDVVRSASAAPPSARSVGVPAPSAAWTFRKSPLGVAARGSDLSISVPADGHQYLVWMPTADWSGGLTAEVAARWTTVSVTVRTCTTGVDYLGGILAEDAARCFPLRVQQPGRAPVVRRISLASGVCR